jgi:hypothetical protein
MNKIFIYTPKITSRVSYIFDLIFNQLLGIPKVSLTSDLYTFSQTTNAAKINYSRSFMLDVPYFFPDQLLLETGIRSLNPTFKKHDTLIAAFFHVPAPNNEQANFPFDPFALAFYLVSRYEEYLDFPSDKFGRFSASNSQAYKNDFLQQPLVNLWALKIKRLLEKKYPKLQFNCPKYQYSPSYDIDYAYAFLQKGWLRQTAAFGKNLVKLDLETLSLQLKTWFRLQKDPYDTFSYLEALDNKYQLKPIYFWLLGDYGTHDKNIHYNNNHFQQLIQTNAQKYPVGIHPSFGSNKDQNIVDKEIHRLEKITAQRTKKSRQHFLILELPKTYEQLVNLGIQEDYSMGYAQHLGFRASIAHPFYWYNLKTEEKTSLQIFPFQLMDVTFNTYLKRRPEEVLDEARPIIQNTKEVGGHLISIWHNSSLCEAWQWKGWREVYEALIEEALKAK